MTKNKEGRPSKFKPEYAKQAFKLCLLGQTDAQLATFFEVNEDTIHEWKKKHLEFSESTKQGKIIADARVAYALYRRAIGYKYEEVTFEKVDNGSLDVFAKDLIMTEAYRKRIVVKELPPDVGAALKWLSNRQKDHWRDKLSVELASLPENQLDELFLKHIKHSQNAK